MHHFRLASFLLAGTVALSACADDVTAPAATHAPADAVFSAGSPEAGRHLFVFTTRSIPADFGARVAAAGGTIEKAFAQLGIAATQGLSPEAAESLGAAADVAHWNPEIQVVLDAPVGEMILDAIEDEVLSEPASPGNPTTASFYPRQWHLRQIGADRAWAAGRLGSRKVKVGILDTGIDYRHADLAGLVDLSLSKSFIPSENAVVQQLFPGAHEVADLHYHGTHVAATVASNAVAAAGVTSNVTLVGLKVLNRNGSGSTFGTLNAIEYAADVGLDVINMSLGIPVALPRRDNAAFNEMINRVMTYAHSRGVTVIVAAGNENMDLDKLGNAIKVYCTASTVACISATGPTSRTAVNGPWQNIDAKASYSNYGRAYVHVAAPGGNGSSSVTAACSGFSLNVPVCRTGTFVVGLNGTSMASPHAAGLAALMVERYGRKPSEVKEALAKFSDDLGPLGNDPVYGKGRINVAKALGL
ncbi:MAG TPA: S8 family serine peptidase [Longimicrobiaceae bacterium]|nr:S8 family serine peptidase [Longimicrobiaceae bacterium]